jgi:N-formylglutamate deformylase
MKEPIVVSVPHGGWKVAEDLKEIWALTDKKAFHDGDAFTARIYDFSDRVQEQLVMEYYRAVIDLNRAPDDSAPANPDGVIKSHTCYNEEVYKPDCLPAGDFKDLLLEKYYAPYHQALERALGRDGIRLGVDCHSMAAVSPPIEKDAGTPRPLICLGNLGDNRGEITEEFGRVTCPPDLVNFMADQFTEVFQHEDVELEVPGIATMNVPFNGGYITRQTGAGAPPFVQIEMSRVLYLSKPRFDDRTLEIDDRRVKDLNAKVWKVLEKTVRNI